MKIEVESLHENCCFGHIRVILRTLGYPPARRVRGCLSRQFVYRDNLIAKIPSLLGIVDILVLSSRALIFLTASRFSGYCFRLCGIFERELSRSLVDNGLLVRTPIASDPPNRTSNYPTAGLTAYGEQ